MQDLEGRLGQLKASLASRDAQIALLEQKLPSKGFFEEKLPSKGFFEQTLSSKGFFD